MPAYDYRCPKCLIQNEITHGWHDRPMIPCTYCNEPMVKVINPIAAHFKGTGWGKD